MKANLTCVLTLSLLATATSQAIAGANCAHSQSWQCTHQQSATGTTDPGAVIPDHQTLNPNTGSTNEQLGTILPDHHNVMLLPSTQPTIPPSQAGISTQQPQQVAQPMQVPVLQPTIPSSQVTSTPQPVAIPQPLAQPMQVPVLQPTIPSSQAAIATPQAVVNTHQPSQLLIEPQRPVIQIAGDSQRPHPSMGQQHTGHMLVTHQPLTAIPSVTSGTVVGQYGLEMIEPGIENHRVEVYRSGDAREATYHDNIPVDAGDFNLTVIGTRNPDYMYLPDTNPRSQKSQP